MPTKKAKGKKNLHKGSKLKEIKPLSKGHDGNLSTGGGFKF
jgi:hypothetical protein